MFQVNIQTHDGWEYFSECETKEELDIIVKTIIDRNITTNIQVLKDNIFLTRVGCNDYQYFYFKNKYILEQNKDFDVIKEFHKIKKL